MDRPIMDVFKMDSLVFGAFAISTLAPEPALSAEAC